MALPTGITPKTVTIGVASFFDGTIAGGRVTITAPVNVVHTPTNRPIFSSSMTKPFVNGEATFDLCPTDAAGLNRVDWTYTAQIEVSGASVQPEAIRFLLPEAGPDYVDLDSLVTVPSSAGTPISVDAVTTDRLDPLTAGHVADSLSQTRQALAAAGLGGDYATNTQLTDGLATKEALGAAASAVSAHELAADPHSQYVAETDPRLADARTPVDGSVTDIKVAAGAAVSLDKTADSTTRLAMAAAERTKLTGVAAGATANATDAQLRDRTTHTGTQAASTVTGLATVATTGAYADLTGQPVIPDSPDDIGAVLGTGIAEIRALTQAEYDAITTPVTTTLYVIKG